MAMSKTEQLERQWEQCWLPIYPLASDDLRAGIYRTSRSSALKLRYIEANPHAISNLLVVDVDHDDALLRAMWDRKNWLPNAVIENPQNGHAHAVWALAEPVTRTEYARRKPLAYAAAVTEGLRRSTDGDKAYSGLITKNPTHPAWDGHWLTDHLYSLAELDFWLSETGYMPPKSWQRTKRNKPVGLSRNCTIFETVRTWAYPTATAIRWSSNSEHATTKNSKELFTALLARTSELNAAFSEPLPVTETHSIAKSVHKWITTKSTLWTQTLSAKQAKFSEIQAARGRKSGKARRLQLDAKLEALKTKAAK